MCLQRKMPFVIMRVISIASRSCAYSFFTDMIWQGFSKRISCWACQRSCNSLSFLYIFTSILTGPYLHTPREAVAMELNRSCLSTNNEHTNESMTYPMNCQWTVYELSVNGRWTVSEWSVIIPMNILIVLPNGIKPTQCKLYLQVWYL